MNGVEKLREFIKEHTIDAELLTYENSTATSHHSTQVLGVSLDKIAKSVVFEDEKKRLYSVILRGSEKVDKEKLKKHFNVQSFKIVPFDDVIHKVGYPAGGVPPFGYDALFVIHSSLEDEEIVYAGGGTTTSILKVSVGELKRANNAIVLDVSL